MKRALHALSGIMLAACNVPVPHGTTGGVQVEAGVAPDASPSVDGSAAARCGRGIVVVEQGPDYASTNVGLIGLDGTVLQGSIASSATASVGLTAPLSGDVVLPTMPTSGSEIVLVDRAPSTGRLVLVDVATPKQRTLSVATGFYSDPQDYVQVSATKAYVPRYRQNQSPGKEPFDRGSDVLIVDPTTLTLTGSIDLHPAMGGDAASALPDASKIVVSAGRAFVLLETLGTDFAAAVPSRLVTIDVATDTITNVLVLAGFENCVGLAISPTGSALAVLCSGAGNIQGSPSEVTDSGVVLVDISDEPRITDSVQAATLGKNRIGFSGDFANANTFVLQTFGYTDANTGATVSKDTLVRLDLTTNEADVILDGDPFSIGGIACDAACRVCFVADSSRQGGVVHRFDIDAQGNLSGDRLIKVERNPGLPPVQLGKF